MAVFHDDVWTEVYAVEARSLPWPVFKQRFPTFPGSYLTLVATHKLWNWVEDIQNRHPGEPLALHFHDGYISGIFLVKPGPNIGAIATIHGIAETTGLQHRGNRIIYKGLMRRVLQYCHSFTTVDTASKVLLKKYFDMRPSDSIVVHNGIEISKLETPSDDGYVQRQRAELVAGLVGNLNENKGWRIAVQAIQAVRRAGGNWRLVIAGFGPDAAAVREAADSNSFIQYLGRVPEAGRSLIPHLDVLLLPSKEEGQPMVVVEAMARGIPVIATPVGGVPEMITDGTNGILSARDAESFALALRRIENADVRRNLGAAASATMAQSFDVAGIAQTYEGLYRQAIR